MTTVNEALRRLLETSRGRGRLGPAADRDAIGIAASDAYPSSEIGGGGIASPLTEQEYTGETFYAFTSSCGFVVFEFGDVTTYIDAATNIVNIVNLDPDAP